MYLLVAAAGVAEANDAVRAWEGTIELPSYEISAPEKSPVFDCKWSYQRARRSIYPYVLNDNLYARKSEVKSWKALYLENEWVKLCVLPEIGGRLFYAIDKTDGYDIFYRQDAIKPANVGMNGAWISGGVDWNVFHHHRISTQMPCDWRLVANADGSQTIWLGETERRHRMSWAIGITLRPGSSCMEIDGRLVNCTEDSNSMLFWANVATHANQDYQIIFPQNTEFAAYHAKSSICHWPVCREPFTNVDAYTNNVDVSWWKNHTVGNSLFAFELPENFIGGYDHGKDAGTMLVGNRHIVRGGKFWSWGPNSGWPTKILTDARGHYVELMVAAYSDSQPDYNWSAPGETKTFRQYWYGVRNLKGIKQGNENFAINMEKTQEGRLFLALNATRRTESVTVKVQEKGREVLSRTISAAPDRPWSETVDLPAGAEETDYTMKVVCNGREELSYTPTKHDLSKPCPPAVKAPARPRDIASIEECYYVGLRAEQFHQPYVDANDYYEEVLRRDPMDVRANTRLGIYWRRHWNLAKAEKHLRAALVRQTKDYTRVKDGEAMYNLGLVLAEQGRTDEAIDCLYRAVWTYEYNSAANLALARIYSARGDVKMALDRVDEAIDYNAHNLDAKCLKATLTGDKSICDGILAFDPLNAYALYERDGKMLSDDPEYAVELALKYRANGFPAKCREVLEKADARGGYPTVKLLLGKVDEFLSLPVGYCNPFRREEKDALEAMVAERPGAALAWYYLGNVYGNVDAEKAMDAWAKCAALDPSNAYAERNLGYGHWKWTKDYSSSLGHYRRAIGLKPDEAFFLEECDHVAEEARRPVAERYAMLKSHHEAAMRRSGPLTSECVTGIFCGDYDRILGILRTSFIPTFEGAADMHDIYVDALVLKAAELEKAGDVAGAISLYEETEEFPENQQVFVEFTKRRPRDAQVWHLMGCAYERLGDALKAREWFRRSAAVDTLRTDWCYWKALSLRKLGDEAAAQAIGEAMRSRGSAVLEDYVDFFDYEGNRYGSTKDAKNAANAYTKALGELLLGDEKAAHDDFSRCLDLKPDHLWAKNLSLSPMPVAAGEPAEAAGGRAAGMPFAVVAAGDGFTNRLSLADAKWTDGNVSVSINGDGCVSVSSPGKRLCSVTLSWKREWPRGAQFLNDAWERSYGELEWQAFSGGEIVSPWYFLAAADGKTCGIGVETQPSAMACWKVGTDGFSLVLDVRAGGRPVRLGGRVLRACRVVRAESTPGESAWQFGRRFCRMMCPRPKLPKSPVYGYNDWYCAYGKNTATNFLADAEYVVACAKECENPPYVVMDDGWQKNSPPVVGESGRGPWDAAGPNFGMEMPEFCRAIAALGAKPGLWYRPLRAWDELPEEQRLVADRNYLDPTVPSVRSRIVEDMQRFREWGFKLVKIDYLSYDLSQIWPSGNLPHRDRYIQDDRAWRDDSRTTAEVMLDLYRAMKDAAGDDVVIIGCNALNHLAAGVFELQRTGNDTSGRDWEWTRRNGVNTLAMRSIQDGAFFKIDADCVGLASEGAVPWALNRQWMELLGRSGTPMFVSWRRELATPEVRNALSESFRRASSVCEAAEPIDWFETRQPRRWRFADGTTADYDWSTKPIGRMSPDGQAGSAKLFSGK